MKKLIAILSSTLFSNYLFACVEMNKFEYCEGSLVINQSGVRGQIKVLFPNNMALVNYPSYSKSMETKLEMLAISTGESEGFKFNDLVITPDGKQGTISGIFQNKDVSIYKNDFWKHTVYSPKQLALPQGCTANHYCVDQKVINKYGKIGTIVGIFPKTEKVYLSFPHQELIFAWKTSDLELVK